MTLGLIEEIVTGNLGFEKLLGMDEIEYVKIEDFTPNFSNVKYKKLFLERLQNRVEYIDGLYNQDILPIEARESILSIINKVK